MTAALVAAAGLFAAIVMSAQVFSRRIEARHPPAGNLVDVGSCRIDCVDLPLPGSVAYCFKGDAGNLRREGR